MTLRILVILALLGSTCAAEPAKRPTTAPATQPAVKNVGVEDFEKLAADKDNVILDVRTPREFKSGHLPGAVNVDYQAKDFDEKIAALDKSKTYLVHCAIGGRSAKACEKLNKLSFPNLYNLEGGIAAWKNKGKPVEKD
jgi:phage shock protein E